MSGMSETDLSLFPRDKPWLMRTYSGHSTAAASNALYRTNLARGQTGLSVAFDLPTQTGYDSDHPLARGEVGKVGVPIGHLGDMETLFEAIPLDKMNTSMTINATAPWLMALYVAAAEKKGIARAALSGTVQNDIIKEYLSRGTHVYPPKPSLRLTTDVIAFTAAEMPKWNPVNICSYHLQEAGATPIEELAFALANAIAVLDAVKARGDVLPEDFPRLVGRLSFFVNAGVRLVTEICKMRAFVDLWDEITRERYGVKEPKFRRFRYGVQVNSLGLTEPQPENNVYRILIEMLAVVLSKDARARAVQLPAWNEAMGLPRPWDQQWSLRLQQIVAFETDLLEFDDIFTGSPVIEARTAELADAARAELAEIEKMGGALEAIESSYMKRRLVESNAKRVKRIESGEQIVVGVNEFTESAPSPLTAGGTDAFLAVDPNAEEQQVARLVARRATRDDDAVKKALAGLTNAAAEGRNVMEPSIACAHVGVTTGEWGETLREIFGEYRAPTGVVGVRIAEAIGNSPLAGRYNELRDEVAAAGKRLGRPLTILVGKPGLDGHSNGAEQIAVTATECGMKVVYDGIRLTPEQIVERAKSEQVHLLGLSVLSGSHLGLTLDVIARMKAIGLSDVPVVVGGIIPDGDAARLIEAGVAKVFTPKDYEMAEIMADMVTLAAPGRDEAVE